MRELVKPTIFEGNFADQNTTLGQLASAHLSTKPRSSIDAHDAISHFDFSSVIPNIHAKDHPTASDIVEGLFGRAESGQLSGTDREDFFSGVRRLVALERGEIDTEDAVAQLLEEPGQLVDAVLQRSVRTLRLLEGGDNPLNGLEHPGKVGAAYFASRDTDGSDQVTKVSWFNAGNTTFDQGERPKGVSRRLWIARAALITQIIPAVRIDSFRFPDSVDSDENARTDTKGYSLSRDGDLMLTSSTAAARLNVNNRATPPYVTTLEQNTRVLVKDRRVDNIGKLTVAQAKDTVEGRKFVGLLEQIRPDNAVVGVGLDPTLTKGGLAQAVTALPPERLLEIERDSRMLYDVLMASEQ